MKSQKVIQANETDKALFDFDEEIDNLNQVSNRYPHEQKSQVPKMFQVKRVVRPNLPKSVLDDINKMKKQMSVKDQSVKETSKIDEEKLEAPKEIKISSRL